MTFHARDMNALVSDIMLLRYGEIRDRAKRIASDVSVSRPAAADDLVQDTWEVAMSKGCPRCPLGAWLTGVMRNLARFGARSDSRRARRDADFANDAVGAQPDELLIQIQTEVNTKVRNGEKELPNSMTMTIDMTSAMAT